MFLNPKIQNSFFCATVPVLNSSTGFWNPASGRHTNHHCTVPLPLHAHLCIMPWSYWLITILIICTLLVSQILKTKKLVWVWFDLSTKTQTFFLTENKAAKTDKEQIGRQDQLTICRPGRAGTCQQPWPQRPAEDARRHHYIIGARLRSSRLNYYWYDMS